MAPTSLAPCTLFCPRIGIICAPHLPIMPQASSRLSRLATISVPVACWVSPIAQSVEVRGPRAYISAARRIDSPGMPVIFSPTSQRVGSHRSSHLLELAGALGDELGVGEPGIDDVAQHAC